MKTEFVCAMPCLLLSEALCEKEIGRKPGVKQKGICFNPFQTGLFLDLWDPGGEVNSAPTS